MQIRRKIGPLLGSDPKGSRFSLRFNKVQGILARTKNILYFNPLKGCKKKIHAYIRRLTFN